MLPGFQNLRASPLYARLSFIALISFADNPSEYIPSDRIVDSRRDPNLYDIRRRCSCYTQCHSPHRLAARGV